MTAGQPTPDPAPGWLQARVEQEAERMARKGLIRQYRDEHGRLCWELTEEGRRRLADEQSHTKQGDSR